MTAFLPSLWRLFAIALAICCAMGASDVWAQEEEKAEEEASPPIFPVEGNKLFKKRLGFRDELFSGDIEWVNCEPLTLKGDLKGKFVLLDFWTFCCINCMHILPELEKLEEKYANELVVIGVHSPKFENEKDLGNVRKAVSREAIKHPVINDPEHTLWNLLGVSSWPTILLIDPDGHAVMIRGGEFKAEDLAAMLDKAIPIYRKSKSLDEKPVDLKIKTEVEKDGPLSFPGKAIADEELGRLFIADTDHHRIVVTDLEGKTLDVIGTGKRGLTDGDYATATFQFPNGLARKGDTLYVADTENHALRKIDLKNKKVATIAGDGVKAEYGFPGMTGYPYSAERFASPPAETKLASPWDLLIHGDSLYIAMAGPHLLWRMPLDESEFVHFAGNGREDIVDGPLHPEGGAYAPGASSFAQPSGLATDGKWLYVADSEGSSIRRVPLDKETGADVETVVGTARLRQGRLFHFGDVDGDRETARFQHCLGVAYLEGKIYVADTYNNKIRVIDVETQETTTLAGDGKAGATDDPPRFDHLGGLSVAKGKLYVADTNSHAIRVVDPKSGKTTTLKIEGLAPPK